MDEIGKDAAEVMEVMPQPQFVQDMRIEQTRMPGEIKLSWTDETGRRWIHLLGKSDGKKIRPENARFPTRVYFSEKGLHQVWDGPFHQDSEMIVDWETLHLYAAHEDK